MVTPFYRLPEELRAMKRWVVAGAESKAPMIPMTHFRASTADPSTWRTFDEALQSITCGIGDYPGFVFAGDGVVGIDIDHCIDEDGFATPKAIDILRHVDSYTEISKSGHGIHVLARGKLPWSGRNNRDGVEIYEDKRFFILTGRGYGQFSECQKGIDYVLREYFQEDMRHSEGNRRNRVYQPTWTAPDGRRVPLRPQYPRIPQGCRNICLTSLGGLLHTIGYPPNQIYYELSYANQEACDPPLSDSEVRQVTQSVIRYVR